MPHILIRPDIMLIIFISYALLHFVTYNFEIWMCFLYKPLVKAMKAVITITMILESDCVVEKPH